MIYLQFLALINFCMQCWCQWEPLCTAGDRGGNAPRDRYGLWGNHALCPYACCWCVWKSCHPEGLSFSNLIQYIIYVCWHCFFFTRISEAHAQGHQLIMTPVEIKLLTHYPCFIQILEHGPQSCKRELISRLIGHVVPPSRDMYGCRVIQKVS
jgi:hypothetical protein